MAKVSFFLNNGDSKIAVLQYQVSYLGKQKKGSTKTIQVPRNAWSIKRKTIEPKKTTQELQLTRDSINALQDFISSGLENQFETAHGRFPTFSEFVDKLQIYIAGKREVTEVKSLTLIDLINEFKSNTKGKDSYHDKTNQLLAHLLGCERIKVSFIEWVNKKRDYRTTFLLSDFDKAFALDYAQYLVDQRAYINTSVENHVKRIVTVINWHKRQSDNIHENKRSAKQKEVLKLPNLKVNSLLQELNYKTTKEDPSEMVYPSIAEIKEISQFDSIGENGQVKDKWDKVRDCFLVACFTGIRYNEFHDRQIIDIQERTYIKDGKKLKSFVMANTDDKTQGGINEVPCSQMLVDIIEKWKQINFNVSRMVTVNDENGNTYREREVFEKALFPIISNPKVNEYLHEILFEIGLRQMKIYHGSKVTRDNYTDFQGVGFMTVLRKIQYSGHNKVEKEMRRFEAITFHKARHAFGSYLLELGYKMIEVSRMLGHKKLATTERWYAHVDMTTTIADVASRQNEIFGKALSS
jgi:integrase